MSSQTEQAPATKEGGATRPPEPPAAPITWPLYEEKDGQYWCKVPGCSKAKTGFARIGLHLSRLHGLTAEGAPHANIRRSAAPPAPAPKPMPYVSVRAILQGADLALVEQAIRVIEFAKNNLTGKLTDMEMLAARSEKLGSIIMSLKELI